MQLNMENYVISYACNHYEKKTIVLKIDIVMQINFMIS